MLFILSIVVAVEVGNANIPVTLGASSEMLDHNGCEDCLSCAGGSRTKKRLLTGFQPRLEFPRLQNPLARSWLPLVCNVAVVTAVVDFCDPVENRLICLITILTYEVINTSRRVHDVTLNAGEDYSKSGTS